jgi:hypothetical protein
MTSNLVLPFSADRAQPRTDRVVIHLLIPQPTSCAPCQNAIEEIDDAAALLAQELAARGTAVQVRVTTRTNPATPCAYGVGPPLELRVNGVAIEPRGTQDCGDGGATACGTYEWDGATYAAPPAELLTAVIHDYLDRNDRDPGVIGGSVRARAL